MAPADRGSGERVEDGRPSAADETGEETLVTEPRQRHHDRGLERGSTVGRYVILERLGAGGMGVVYSAYDPELDRKIAIKMLHVGDEDSAGGTDGRARLIREAQALARLSHPNVVAVHDVGEHLGQVFVAMEFIEGETFSVWLARRGGRGTWREVLSVLVPAGRGLVAAHDKGIVHRDFKPDNIMLGADGRVRVLDFGLARAASKSTTLVSGRASDASGPVGSGGDVLGSSITRAGATPGTPAYMSPEQHAGETIEAASDQFSFCVAVYEAVYGERPFVGSTAAALSIAILEGRLAEPPSGSDVPRWLRRVILRGLAREPEKRWPSVQALLAELEHDPTRARRRWIGLGAAAVAIVGVMGSVRIDRARDAEACRVAGDGIAKVWDDAARERVRAALLANEATYAASSAQRVEEWLDEYAEAWTNTRRALCPAGRVGNTMAPALRERALECMDERRQAMRSLVDNLADESTQPLRHAVSSAAGLPTIGQCEDLAWLGSRTPRPKDPDAATQAVEIERQLLEVTTLHGLDQNERAVELATQAVGAAESLGWEPLIGRARYQLGVALDGAGEYEDAHAAHVSAYIDAIAAGEDELAARAASMAGFVLGVRLARTDEGMQWAQMAKASLDRTGLPDGLTRATWLANFGGIEYTAGHYDRARELYSQSLAIRREILGDDHPIVGSSLSNVAVCAGAAGDVAASLELLTEATGVIEAALGPDHPTLATELASLARMQMRVGDEEAAAKTMRRSYDIQAAALPPDHPDLAKALVNLANTIDDPEEKRVLLGKALPIMEKSMGETHPWVTGILNNLGLLHSNAGDPAAALPLLERALEIQKESQGPEHPTVALMLRNIASARRGLRDFEGAEAIAREALAIREKALGPDHPDVADSLTQVGETLLVAGRPKDAVDVLERALSLHLRIASDAASVGGCRFSLARARWESKQDRKRAVELATQARASFAEAGTVPEKVDAVDAWLADRDG